MAGLDPIEQAMVDGACRALNRHAAELRHEAGRITIRIKDQWDNGVEVVPPEAVIKIGTAALLDECAADVAKMRMA